MPEIVSTDYVRARWAYSELPSGRYSGTGVPGLTEKARQRVLFDELGQAGQNVLVDQFDRVRGRYFNRYLIGATSFQVAQWGRDELGAIYVIPWFVRDVVSEGLMSVVRLTFKQWVEAEPVRALNQGHARYAAFGAAPSSMYDDPLTVGCYPQDGVLLLLDGYNRAVRFWSENEPGAKLSVYLPEEPQAIGYATPHAAVARARGSCRLRAILPLAVAFRPTVRRLASAAFPPSGAAGTPSAAAEATMSYRAAAGYFEP
jgi:hypothetical protein